MKEITAGELKNKMDSHADFQLIDVREQYEYDLVNLGGELIPVGSVLGELDKISREKDVILYCRSGSRSGAIIRELETKHGFNNLYNLKGGILAYAKEVDNSLPVY
jgi:rhodanese-related sulfurtransferase